MEYIKEWAARLIVLLLITAILKFIMPSGNIKNTVNAVLSIIVLATLLSPLCNISKADFEIPEFEPEFESSENENSTYNNAIEQAVRTALENNEIEYKDIIVNSSVNDGYLVIESIDVNLKDINKLSAAYEAIGSISGVDKEVIDIHD